MTGSEFVKRYRNASAAKREEAIFRLVQAGEFVGWPWVSVPIKSDGVSGEFFAAADYFAIGTPDDFVRMPISPVLAQRIADEFGWSLPTKRMVDSIWMAARIRLKPQPIRPDSKMETLGRFDEHNSMVEAERAKARTGFLVAGHKKDIVIANTLRAGKVAIYGWHDTNGRAIQGPGVNASSHHDRYADYSHGARFIRGDVEIGGREYTLAHVLSDPKLSDFVSDEGPLLVLRQPGVESAADSEIIEEVRDVLKSGDKGLGVVDWQGFLNDHGFRGSNGTALALDGDFGANTVHATKSFQRACELTPDGVVGPMTLAAAAEFPIAIKTNPEAVGEVIEFVPARHFTKADRKNVDLVVIHDMEYPERPTGAEWCAEFFAGPNAPKASAHYCVDNDSIVRSVREEDIAWHAPGANANGIGIEHAGYAKQTADEWADPYSVAMLERSARLVARICKRWNIPIVRLSPDDLKRKKRGICGHDACTKAWPVDKNGKARTHWDPGPNFPWDWYLSRVRAAFGE